MLMKCILSGMLEGEKIVWIARQGVRGDGNDVVGEEVGMRRDGDDVARRSRGRGEMRQR